MGQADGNYLWASTVTETPCRRPDGHTLQCCTCPSLPSQPSLPADCPSLLPPVHPFPLWHSFIHYRTVLTALRVTCWPAVQEGVLGTHLEPTNFSTGLWPLWQPGHNLWNSRLWDFSGWWGAQKEQHHFPNFKYAFLGGGVGNPSLFCPEFPTMYICRPASSTLVYYGMIDSPQVAWDCLCFMTERLTFQELPQSWANWAGWSSNLKSRVYLRWCFSWTWRNVCMTCDQKSVWTDPTYSNWFPHSDLDHRENIKTVLFLLIEVM